MWAEGGPRAPRVPSPPPFSLTSRGAGATLRPAAGQGRRGPTALLRARVPDSRSQQARTRLREEVADQDTCRGAGDASPAPAAATSGNLLGALLSPPRPGPQPAFHDLLSPAHRSREGGPQPGHPRNLGPGRSPHAGHRRPAYIGTPPPPCLPHALRVTARWPKVPDSRRAQGRLRGAHPPQRPQAQRPGAARVPCPSPQETIGAPVSSALHPFSSCPAAAGKARPPQATRSRSALGREAGRGV